MINLTDPPAKDGFTITMALVCVAGFGGFASWAGLAPLEEGVAAGGQIVAEDNRKVVQHLEGGIVDAVAVREGDRVEAGDVLLRLQDTAALARRDQVAQEVAAFVATVARLTALQGEAASPDFSALASLALGAPERADIIEREADLFDQQRQALAAELEVLASRRDGAVTTEGLRAEQIVITERSLAAAQDELRSVRTMFDQQLARRDQVANLEQRVAGLEADIARLHSEQEDAAARARDLEGQIAQARARFAQDMSAALLDARAKLLAAQESLAASQDVLDRSVIMAPVAGAVLNLSFSTKGGVVRPGEPILEIVPPVRTATAAVRIRPTDRASVFVGQRVRTRISAYRSWRAPRLEGEVVSVSADLKSDPATGAAYYEARVELPPVEVQGGETAARVVDVRPGMPVEAFIFSGVSRTTFDYLFAPLSESLFRGFRSS